MRGRERKSERKRERKSERKREKERDREREREREIERETLTRISFEVFQNKSLAFSVPTPSIILIIMPPFL